MGGRGPWNQRSRGEPSCCVCDTARIDTSPDNREIESFVEGNSCMGCVVGMAVRGSLMTIVQRI